VVTVWSKRAASQLHKAYLYIKMDSLQNTEIVLDDIIDLTINLCNNPEKHPLDQLKKPNDGTWRAFEKHHYRISYRIIRNEVRIVRLRHTSRSPLTF
jgi:plasmid stabilization system protein ParE